MSFDLYTWKVFALTVEWVQVRAGASVAFFSGGVCLEGFVEG